MKNKNRLTIWLLRITFLLIIFSFSLTCIFLMNPQYFIEDIEGYVHHKLSSSMEGTFNLGKIEGNFLNGFIIGPVKYLKGTTVLFSAKDIYIDPDLSRLAFGTIALSEVNKFLTSSSFPKKIIFVCYDKENLKLYKKFIP